MKNVLLIFVVSFSISTAFAGRGVVPIRPNYILVSDEFNGAIPKGKCLVVGHVYWNDYAYTNGKTVPISGGSVATLDREKSFVADSTGQFKLLLDVDDTSLFYYQPGYEEIVIWNFNFQSQHVVTIDFYPLYNAVIEVAKPVVYLYSDKKVDAEIQFSCNGDLTFTYPEYNDGWKVSVEENIITEKESNKTLPYLFWEAETNQLDFVMTFDENEILQLPGFVIRTDTVVNFLENSLTALGLNSTEQTDFITFWAPKMIQKEYAFVQFLVDDWYTQFISEMTINPQPDALRRVYMLFKPLDKTEINIAAIPQELKSFERKAFTVVEWGGSEIINSKIVF